MPVVLPLLVQQLLRYLYASVCRLTSPAGNILCVFKVRGVLVSMLKQSAFVFHGFHPRLELFKPKAKKVEGSEASSDDDEDRDDSKGSNMENDFVVVLPGLIISIECKATLDNKQFRKACKQWARLKRVLEEELGLGSEFKFVKCLAYQNTGKGYEQSEACPDCKPFLLKWMGEEDFQAKIRDLLKAVPRKPQGEEEKGLFKNAVRDLLIFTSRRDDGSDGKTRVADAFFQRHSQIVNTPAETVFFWDPEQYDIIKQDKKLVLLKGSKSALVVMGNFIR